MSNALQRADKSEILRKCAALEFSEDQYRHNHHGETEGSNLTVTDGKETLRARLLWAFGLGTAGQTYVFEHMGADV